MIIIIIFFLFVLFVCTCLGLYYRHLLKQQKNDWGNSIFGRSVKSWLNYKK